MTLHVTKMHHGSINATLNNWFINEALAEPAFLSLFLLFLTYCITVTISCQNLGGGGGGGGFSPLSPPVIYTLELRENSYQNNNFRGLVTF